MERDKNNLTCMNDDVLKQIHNHIHGGSNNTLWIGDKGYKCFMHSNGCRYMDYEGVRFMEQNKNKRTEFAIRARQGTCITWGIRDGSWIRIEGNNSPIIIQQ